MTHTEAQKEIQAIRGTQKRMAEIGKLFDEGKISRITFTLLVNRFFGDHNPSESSDRATCGDYAS